MLLLRGMNSNVFKNKAFRNLLILVMLSVSEQVSLMQANQLAFAELPAIHTRGQVEHAFELMKPSQYSKVLAMGPAGDQRQVILELVEQSLPADQKGYAFEISAAVITEANKHHMDPFFLLSVIAHESHFDRTAKGSHGEVGLMQILPSTANWIAARNGMSKDFDLQDPSTNIRLGATYLAQLRKSFKRNGTRYMAAYNMGSRNVRRLLASSTEPTIYSEKVMTIYNKYYNLLARLNVGPYQQTASN